MRNLQWFLLLLAGLLGWQSAAWALDCNTTVVDEAGVLNGAEFTRVNDAAAKLNLAGADARVRIIPDAAVFGNLDQYQATMEQSCAGWRGPDGIRKKNLVTVLLSMDGEYGVYAGSMYERQLTEVAITRIRTQQMLPELQNENLGAALVAGLRGSEAVIGAAASVNPNLGTSQGPVTINVAAPSQPTDWTFAWVLLGIAVLALLGYLVWRWRQRVAAFNEALVGAKAARTACAAQVQKASSFVRLLESKLSTVVGAMAPEETATLTGRVQLCVQETNARIAAYGGMLNPEAKGVQVGNLIDAQHKYMRLEASFIEASSVLTTVENELSAAIAKIAAVPAELDALHKEGGAFAAANKAVADAKARGYTTALLDQRIADAAEKAAEAKRALGERRIDAAGAKVAALQSTLAEIAGAANGLDEVGPMVIAECVTLLRGIAEAQTKVVGVTQTLQAIVQRYPESVWSGVEGNDDDASAYLEKASNFLSTAKKLAAAKDDDLLAQAVDAEGEARSHLELATAEISAVTELEALLARAETQAEQELEDAKRDLDALIAYEREHDADVDDGIKQVIADAKRQYDDACIAWTSPKRDILEVIALAKKVNATADASMEKAVGEFQAAERLRSRAASATTSAKTALDLASQYLEKHGGDIPDSLDADLAALVRSFGNAGGGDSRSTITAMDKIKESADSVLSRAKNAVRKAKERREEARRPAPTYHSPSHSGGGDDVSAAILGGIIGAAMSSGSSRRSSGSGSSGSWGGGLGRSSGTGSSGTWGSRMPSAPRSSGTGSSGRWK